ncbi:MAG TPA: DUF3857 domain-containing protein [Candidatus Sulfotelmatobacter sp.]|nr:DUF3857 domain-containing protein [Candidatus Sulfotelmatobacter sp.]
MLRLRSNFFPLIAVLTLLAARSAAADFPAVTPEEKSLTSIPQQPDAPAVVFYREDITDDTKNFHSVYVRLKILTEAGRKYQDVEIVLPRDSFTISQVSGRTVQPDGTVIPWDGQPTDKIAFHDHSRPLHVKAFTLPAVQVGSILDYRYSLHFPEGSRNAPDWLIQTELFQKKVVFKFVPTKYQPKTDSLRGETGSYDRIGVSNLEQVTDEFAWVSHLPPGKQPEDHALPTDQFHWVGFEMTDVAPAPHEPDMPPVAAVSWRIDMFYRLHTKPETYWKGVSKTWDKNLESFLDHKNGIAEAVSKLVDPGDAPDAKVRKIYEFVSQLQNQSFSTTPSAIALTPAAGVDDVLKNRGGTHDELNRLFVAMVRAAGTPALMTWVPDRSRGGFDMSYMSVDQLDAEIAIVPLAGQDTFLDPGTKFCPYGLLPWSYAGVRGLRQDGKGNETMADTPAPTYKGAVIQRMARLQIADKGAMQGQLAVGFTGQDAMLLRQKAAGLSAADRKTLLEDTVTAWLPAGTKLSLTNTPAWEDGDAALTAQFKVTGTLASNNGQKWTVPVQIFEANAKPRFSSAQRTNPIYFDYASRRVDEVHITLPANVAVDTLPPAAQAKTPYALYAAEQKAEGTNGFVSTRDMAMNGVIFNASEYKTIKDFYDKVAAGDAATATLKGSL